MNFLLFPNPIYCLCLSSPCLPFKLENIKSWKIFSLEQFSRDWGEFFLTWVKLLAGTWNMNVLKIFGFKNRRKRNQILGAKICCLYFLLFIYLFHGVTETVAKYFLRFSFFRMGVARITKICLNETSFIIESSKYWLSCFAGFWNISICL